MRTAAGVPVRAKGHRWHWPAAKGACVLGALALLSWVYLRRSNAPRVPELVGPSPDDGHSYGEAAANLTGRQVRAYGSDHGGTNDLWLQQVGGGDPMQLTHSGRSVQAAQFLPDATRIMYAAYSSDSRKRSIEVIHTLGGQPKILKAGDILDAALSPDGRQVAYYEGPESSPSDGRLMLMSSEGGTAKQLSNWHGMDRPGLVWTADGKSLVVAGDRSPNVPKPGEWEWYAVPVDGGDPVKTGAADVFAVAGLKMTVPLAATDQRILFYTPKREATLGNL